MRVFSDLHIEFRDWVPNPPQDYSDLIILAGDICPLNKPLLKEFLKVVADEHEHVIYLPGNHEYYGGTFPNSWEDYEVPSNVYKLNNKRIVIDGQGYVGSTLWTDLSNPLDAAIAQGSMYDYRTIKTPRGRLITPQDITEEHIWSVGYLAQAIQPDDIVITHHMPSYACVADIYKNDPLNCAFATELTELIEQTRPSLWISGHTHHSFDFNWGVTRLVCNPRGYPDERTGFNAGGYIL